MRRLFSLFVSALSALVMTPVHSASGVDPEPVVVRVSTRDPVVIAGIARRHSHVLIAQEKGVIVFESDVAELSQLRGQGLEADIDERATAAMRDSMTRAPMQVNGIPNFPCYRTVAESNLRFDELASQHPGLARIVDIGDSWERASGGGAAGEDLRVIVLGNQAVAGVKPKTFIMTGLHAREYTPVELGLRLAEWLLDQHGVDADATWLLDHQELHLLVQSNPDGRKRAEQGSMWRKNTNSSYCSAGRRGADLNRNFPFEWGAHNGSSGNTCDDTYRGPMPASEPESQAVINYVRSQFPDARGPLASDAAPVSTSGLFFDIHSFSSLVIWPWGYTAQVAPNGPALETLGRRMAWFNDYAPQQAIDLYVTDGTTDDFAYGELGLAAYTFELGNQFFESCSAFEASVYPDNFAALVYSLRTARAPYLLPSGPEARGVVVAPDLALTGESIRVSGTLDDTRFNQSEGGTQPSHAIVAASAFVGLAPWQAGAQPLLASANDGGFDQPIETVSTELAGGVLAAGRHLVYLQGRDASGSDGVVSAAFADVRAPADVGTVSGRVSDLSSGLPIAGARVRAAGFQSSSAADGNYVRRVPAGTHLFEIAAADFESLEVAGVVAPGGGAVTRNFALFPLCEVLGEDAENGAPGWIRQSPWGIVDANAQHASRFFTDSPAGNYANNVNTSLTSPAFDLVGYANPVLSFESRCDTEAGFDFGIVEVRASAGSAWVEVHRCDNRPQWQSTEIALPGIAGSAAAQIRFRLDSDGGVVRDGWSVDNIFVRAGGPACRAATPVDTLFANGFE